MAAAVGGTYVEAEATSGNKNRIPDLLRKYKFEDDDEFNFKLRISSDAYVGVNFRLGNKIELEYFYDMKSHPTEGGFSMDRRKFTEEILVAVLDYAKKISRVRTPPILSKFRG